MSADPITFHVDGRAELDGNLTAVEFGTLFSEWALALSETSDGLGSGGAGVEWILSAFELGSATATYAPIAESIDAEAIAEETSRLVIIAMNQGAQGVDPGTILPAKAAKHMAQFLHLVKDKALPLVSATSGDLSALITGVALPPSPRLASYRAPSSIEGILLGVTYAGSSPSFSVRLRLTEKLVNCYFRMPLSSQVETALRKRVAVQGMVTYRSDGEPTSVADVERIYVFPEQEDLPSVESIVGLDPDLTEGLPAE